MDNTEKKGRSGGTVGVGYISIMLIFTVICLTIFAVLSFQAVYSSDKMTNRSDGFTQQYYTADTEAKKTLSRLDGLAAEAFIEAVSGVEGVSAARTAGGVRVEYSQAINERQTLAVSVMFFSAPSGERFRIEKWNSTEKEISGESHPSVWDGEDLV